MSGTSGLTCIDPTTINSKQNPKPPAQYRMHHIQNKTTKLEQEKCVAFHSGMLQ